MKKLFLLTLICMLSLTFVACEKKEETKEITAEDIEIDEEFQKILLQSSMNRTEPLTMEKRVDLMLQLLKDSFKDQSLLSNYSYISQGSRTAVDYAFSDAPEVDVTTRNKLREMIYIPLDEVYGARLNGFKRNIDWDTLIPELRAKAFEILGIKGE